MASPGGGAAPYDPKSLGEEAQRPASVKRFLEDEEALSQVRATLPLAEVQAEAWDAIFLCGGHGAMWDLPVDARLGKVLGAAFDAGRVVSAVCHGPAGLVGARARDGKPIVAGRRLTAFSNEEEAAIQLTGVVPFLLQSRLTELGGRFESAAPWQPHAVRDGNLVTGQNPQSSARVAALVLEALG